MAHEWDFFVSHASEDKAAVAEPLAHELAARKHRVWYDRWNLTLGDSLLRKINEGLASSRFGVVVLSPSFFSKNWPQSELDGLMAIENSAGWKVILPVWHNVSRDDVAKYSPILAGRLAVATSVGIAAVADAIVAAFVSGTLPPAGPASPPASVPVDWDRVFEHLASTIPARREESIKAVHDAAARDEAVPQAVYGRLLELAALVSDQVSDQQRARAVVALRVGKQWAASEAIAGRILLRWPDDFDPILGMEVANFLSAAGDPAILKTVATAGAFLDRVATMGPARAHALLTVIQWRIERSSLPEEDSWLQVMARVAVALRSHRSEVVRALSKAITDRLGEG